MDWLYYDLSSLVQPWRFIMSGILHVFILEPLILKSKKDGNTPFFGFRGVLKEGREIYLFYLEVEDEQDVSNFKDIPAESYIILINVTLNLATKVVLGNIPKAKVSLLDLLIYRFISINFAYVVYL